MDLLSGENYPMPKTDNSLALVPVNELPPSPPSQQNVLALSGMFSQNNGTSNSLHPHSAYSTSQVPSLQPPQPALHSNGSITNSGQPQYEPTPYAQGTQLNPTLTPTWNGQDAQSMNLQQQTPVYGASPQGNDSLPLPPWELQQPESSQLADTQLQMIPSSQSMGVQPQTVQSSQQPIMHSLPTQSNPMVGMYPQLMQSSQMVGMYPQPMQSGMMVGMYPQPMQSGQLMGVYPQPIQAAQMAGSYPPPLQSNQTAGMYFQPMQGGQPAYGYQQPGAQYLEQRMYGLSIYDNSRSSMTNNSSYNMPLSSYVQPNKPSKPEDKLFGDLVDMAKSKNKPNTSKLGSL